MIGIIDGGAGNLRSVEKAFHKIGLPAFISDEPELLCKASALVLPGVGAFAKAMESLQAKGCIPLIREWIAGEKPFLGICLGLQLLFTESEEVFSDGAKPAGLDIIPGTVKRLPGEGLKVPQVGWNALHIVKRDPFFSEIPEGAHVYFVHSYYVEPRDRGLVATETDYGISYCSSVASGRLLAVQFHPEKSGKIGLNLLKKFGELVKK